MGSDNLWSQGQHEGNGVGSLRVKSALYAPGRARLEQHSVGSAATVTQGNAQCSGGGTLGKQGVGRVTSMEVETVQADSGIWKQSRASILTIKENTFTLYEYIKRES